MAPTALEAADLHSAGELEWAEDITAAVARALSADAQLRFRAHLLSTGPRKIPSRAPHTKPRTESQTVVDLRGAADAVALRTRHSRPDVYARHRPDGDLERFLYEVLEQFRVEARAPAHALGVRANLTARFAAWSQEFVGEGLLESDIGLLIFSTLQVCRSRILAEPMDERFSDHTEATRFGLYEIIGPHLVQLRPAIADQDAFAARAIDLARAIADLVPPDAARDGRSATSSSVLAMLSDGDFEDETTDGVEASSRRGEAQRASYGVFTREYDETVDVSVEVPAHAQLSGRAELDAVEAQVRPLAGYVRRGVRDLFGFPEDRSWESECDEGYLDPRLLTRLVTGHHGDRIYRQTSPEPVPRGAVTVLVDCSGSMKAVINDVAVVIDILVRALDEAEVATEVLGYTTRQWSGGRPHREWVAEGRPPHPGRLNETTHLVFKSASTSWRRARSSIGALLWTPLFREGVDGEAVAWAAGRLAAIPTARRHLLLVCDGSPRDGATELANGEGYLDRHLQHVVGEWEASGSVHLAGLGIGHDLSAYLTRSRTVDPRSILEWSTARAILELLGGRGRGFSDF